MTIRFTSYDPAFVARVRAGGDDAYGQPAENAVSDGAGNPCRSCLGLIPKGAPFLIVAACPFPTLQPYAETGPIFLCKETCTQWVALGLPPAMQSSPDYLLKGYSADHRIIYGTGRITPSDEIGTYAETLLANPKVAYVDVRSARNNCFQTRIVRT